MFIGLLLIGLTMALALIIRVWLFKQVPNVPEDTSPLMKKFKSWQYDDDARPEYSE